MCRCRSVLSCASLLLLLFLFGHLNFWIFFFFFMLFNFFFFLFLTRSIQWLLISSFFVVVYFLHAGTWIAHTRKNKQKRNTCTDSYATFFWRVFWVEIDWIEGIGVIVLKLVCNWGSFFLFVNFDDFLWIFERFTIKILNLIEFLGQWN